MVADVYVHHVIHFEFSVKVWHSVNSVFIPYVGSSPCPHNKLFYLCHVTVVRCHFPDRGQPMSHWTAHFGMYLPTPTRKRQALCCTAAKHVYSYVWWRWFLCLHEENKISPCYKMVTHLHVYDVHLSQYLSQNIIYHVMQKIMS